MLGGKLVAMRRANQQDPATNGQCRIVGDHLGSTSLILDTASPPNVVQRTYYKPYGEVAQNYGTTTSTSLTSIGYTGQRLDGESGLMYYGARFYDPVLSNFVSADPTTPDASNPIDYSRYLYTRGNPLRYLDPLGYAPQDHYVFVEGCVPGSASESSAGGRCGNADWGEYEDGLRREYASWRKQYSRYGEESYGELGTGYDDWSRTHVHSIFATSPGNGANKIADIVSNLPSGTGVHLFGHSLGGAAVMEYLDRMYMNDVLNGGKGPSGTGYNGNIKSAMVIDAPDVTSVSPGFGQWAEKRGIPILDVDTEYDWVDHDPYSGVPHNGGNYCDFDPTNCPTIPTRTYPNKYFDPVRRKWHEYTANHASREARQFISAYWK